MTARTVSEKMGIKENARSILINAPKTAIRAIELPVIELTTELVGMFDYIHFFVVTQQEFHEPFPQLKSHLKPTGMLWISWPKSGQNDTDLTIKSVIKLGYEYGLVESKCISIDTTWSALKFTHPKKGKTYNNSYGTLKI